MIAPRSAAANPTSVNTSTAASRIFRRVASDRTWRAIAYIPPEFRLCAELPDHGHRNNPDLAKEPNSALGPVIRSPAGGRPTDHIEPASAAVLLIAMFVRR